MCEFNRNYFLSYVVPKRTTFRYDHCRPYNILETDKVNTLARYHFLYMLAVSICKIYPLNRDRGVCTLPTSVKIPLQGLGAKKCTKKMPCKNFCTKCLTS